MSHEHSFLAVSGSLREQSYSTAVLHTLIARAPANVYIEQASIGKLPFFNQDLDNEHRRPIEVIAFRAKVQRCDGLIVTTPEYNHGLPAVLKNAIDWVSRPAFESVLKGKPVMCITVSPGGAGGTRAHAHLQQLFAATLSKQVIMPPVAIAGISEKVVNAQLTDPVSLEFSLVALQRLVDLVERERIAR